MPPARFHSLEREVLAALAWENDHIVSDLAGQVEEALPGQRRNTDCGFRHEIIVDRDRPSPRERVTGLFGTVHAMIDGLEEAVLFQVELREGRLMALVADSYEQPTAHLDFQTVGYEQVFWIDANGNSQPFEPSALIEPKPAWERADWSPPMDRPMSAMLAVQPANPPTTLERLVRRDEGRGLEDAAFEAFGVTAQPHRRQSVVTAADEWIAKFALWGANIVVFLVSLWFFDLPLPVAGLMIWGLAHFVSRREVLDRVAGMIAERRRATA